MSEEAKLNRKATLERKASARKREGRPRLPPGGSESSNVEGNKDSVQILETRTQQVLRERDALAVMVRDLRQQAKNREEKYRRDQARMNKILFKYMDEVKQVSRYVRISSSDRAFLMEKDEDFWRRNLNLLDLRRFY